MIEIQINEVNKFMSRLLKSDEFDEFFFREGKIQSFMGFEFDGERKTNFYDTEELSELPKGKYIRWSEIKGLFFDQIKGTHTPTLLTVGLVQNDEVTAELIKRAGVAVGAEEKVALNLNITFKNSRMLLCTATYRSGFTLGKELDQAWDTCLKQALTKMDISFEVL